MNTDAKILNEVPANEIQQALKNNKSQSSVVHSRAQGWFNIHKSINVIYNINKTQDSNHMMLSVDTEKASDKIQHPFMIKMLNKMGI